MWEKKIKWEQKIVKSRGKGRKKEEKYRGKVVTRVTDIRYLVYLRGKINAKKVHEDKIT